MDVAERFALLSPAKRLKVGAVIVKDHSIISIGYNGTPSGWSNECEDKNGETKQEVIHAEMNCISKLAKSSMSGESSAMFITHAPCIHCAKAIYGAGIKYVYYKKSYRDELGIKFLKKCGVSITSI
jgi:dCMP deaminase